MNFKKLMHLVFLVLCTTNYNLFTMESTQDQYTINNLPTFDVIEYIFDFLYQPNSMVPVSYLNFGQELVTFAQTSHACRRISLLYTENRIINPLLKFNPSSGQINLNCSNEIDLVSACCAFKIISKIREVGIDDFGKKFCDRQFQELMRLSIFHTSFREICLKPIHWLVSNMMGYGTDFFNATQNALLSQDDRIDLIARTYQKGEDINARDDNGVTALQWAVTTHQPKITQMLLACGANVDSVVNNEKFHREYNGFTALHLAVLREFEDMVSMLLLSSANVDATVHNPGYEFNGYTPLHIATEKGSHAIICELIKAGANINTRIIRRKKINGRTPLHIAAVKNDIETVQVLLALGANPTILVNYNGAKRRADALTTNPEIQQIIQAACDKR